MNTLNATPNRNGNTPEDFLKHGRAVAAAARALRDAMVAARSDCLHGRNYQTTDAPDLDRTADMVRVDSYLTAALAAENFGHELMHHGRLGARRSTIEEF